MKRRSLLILSVLALAHALSAQVPQPGIRCLTDELDHHLKATYPLGVPGKTDPREVETAKTEDFDWTYVIPVVVHVMHDNGPELGVNMAQVQSQIDVLNEDYGRYGAGANTDPDGAESRIRFCLATIDPEGQPTTGLDFYHYPGTADINPFTEDTLLKRVVQWDPDRYLNTYVVRKINGGQIGGYAYFPSEAAGTIYDGFVVDYRFFGRDAGTAVTVSRGRTATHEVGHYLGLLHPWGLQAHNCDMEDDGCDDTPRVNREFFANYPLCSHPAGCDGAVRMVENYMDYSDDRCMNIFTNCQAQIMRNSILQYRSTLVSSENLARTGCAEVLQNDPSEEVFQLFPNPVQDIFMVFVDFADKQTTSIEVFDFRGRRVYYNPEAGFGRGPVAVDMSAYNEGLYHVVVRRDTSYLRKSVLVVR